MAPCTLVLVLHGIKLVVHGRGRARQIVDLVGLDIERERHIVAHQLKIRFTQQRNDVLPAPGEEIVDAQHLVPVFDQSLAQVRADKSCTAGDDNAFHERPRSYESHPIGWQSAGN